MRVLNRRFYDSYFYNLAELCDKKFDLEIIYDPARTRWASCLSENCLVFTQDYFTNGIDYSRLYPSDLDKMNNCKNFYLVSSVYNCGLDVECSTAKWLHAGSDMLMQQEQYKSADPVYHKNKNKHHVICLGLLPRPHRLITASLLLGIGLPRQSVFVDPTIHDNPSFDDYWPDHLLSAEQLDVFNRGWKLLQHNKLPNHQQRYDVSANNNADNFQKNLRNLYQNSTVEVVMETTWYNKGIFVSEKFLHTVYGCNFPILIGNPGTVNYLRNNGFDMFDDVVDHSYDLEPDPLMRIIKAVEQNKKLLLNQEYAWEMHHACKERFLANCDFVKFYMHNHFQDQFISELKQLV